MGERMPIRLSAGRYLQRFKIAFDRFYELELGRSSSSSSSISLVLSTGIGR
jgi:hypothetical protein